MKTKLLLLIAITFSVAVYSQTPVPPGNVSGTWTLAGSPYQVLGETTIPNGQTLTIEPGVVVEWQGSYSMFVEGRILAQGNEADSITFTAADTAIGWRSIRFDSTLTANDTSRFEFCVFRYGKVCGSWPDNCGGAIGVVNFNKLVIDHCLFDQNEAQDVSLYPSPSGGAIALLKSSPMIRNSRFTNNLSVNGGAIVCQESDVSIYNNEFTDNKVLDPNGLWGQGGGGAICIFLLSNPSIINNTIYDNIAERCGGAIICHQNCSPLIDHNLIFDNSSRWGGAIELEHYCNPVLINNTIAYNTAEDYGGGINHEDNCKPVVRNTILWNNNVSGAGNQVYLEDITCVPDFYYCDIQGGQAAFGGYPHTGVYDSCIDADPEFEDPSSGYYGLMNCINFPISPCINAGDPDPVYNDPDGSRNDMGALWPPIPCTGIQEKSFENVFVYPNPAGEIVDYRWSVFDFRCMSIIIVDLFGREVKRIMDGVKSPGEYTIRIDVSDLPAGIYLIRLQAGSESVTRKIVKL